MKTEKLNCSQGAFIHVTEIPHGMTVGEILETCCITPCCIRSAHAGFDRAILTDRYIHSEEAYAQLYKKMLKKIGLHNTGSLELVRHSFWWHCGPARFELERGEEKVLSRNLVFDNEQYDLLVAVR